MLERTRALWERQDQHRGDRQRLFKCVADSVDVETVLYPGSFVDLSPSFVWPSVTYVDIDRRAGKFFDDVDGVNELLRAHGADPDGHAVRFVHVDYADGLEIPDASVDLLISLYAGFVSEHCARYLRPGGFLLVNPSHGDAAMASLDPGFQLWGAVVLRDGRYSIRTDELEAFLVPKRRLAVTAEQLHATQRGVAYTKEAFAYLFQRAADLEHP